MFTQLILVTELGLGLLAFQKPVYFSRVEIIYPSQALRCDHLRGVFPSRNLCPGSVWGMGHSRILVHLAGMAGLEGSRGVGRLIPLSGTNCTETHPLASLCVLQSFSAVDKWRPGPLNTTPCSFWGKVYSEAWLIKAKSWGTIPSPAGFISLSCPCDSL